MAPVLHRATLALATPLGTPLAGDTLFGQCCWALREARGESELTRRLDGYTQGRPWLVVSDGFPVGHLPKPALPRRFEPHSDPAGRKDAKKRGWVPVNRAGNAIADLLASSVDDEAAYGTAPRAAVQFHNSINRLTGTTGKGAFAPYTAPQAFYAPGQRIDLYLVLDDERVSAEEAHRLLDAIGATGFGRDASIGLGKFSVELFQAAAFAQPAGASAYWTLGPCAPQGQGFDGTSSYWRVLTRFGRHGNAHALAGNPFKTPVLLAAAGSVLRPLAGFTPRLFAGRGLGGDGTLSKAEPGTVQQGYCPVVSIALESGR